MHLADPELARDLALRLLLEEPQVEDRPLALAGAVIGGLVGNLTVGARDVSTAGLIGSVLGAIASLVAYRAASGRRAA